VPCFQGAPWIRPAEGQALVLDLDALDGLLADAPPEGAFAVRNSGAVIGLPRPLLAACSRARR